MQQRNSDGRAIFWGLVATGAVAAGILVAILAGYLLGHFTHTHTKTVAERTVTSQAAPAPGQRSQVSASSAIAGKTAELSTKPPALVNIGAGLQGPRDVRASVFAHGPKTIEALSPAPGGAVFASTAAESPKPVNAVYLIKQGARPLALIKHLPLTLGLSWTDNQLYVSSAGSVDVYTDFNGTGFGAHRRILSGLPGGKLGYNGALLSGPDGRMYMAIGSPCDACRPPDRRSATIVSFNRDGSDVRTFATGFRGNAFLAWAPGTSDMFAVSNASNAKPVQPDELDLVREGDDWGYPTCHGQGGPVCDGVPHPLAHLDLHSAANGLTFLTGNWGTAKGLSTLATEWTLGKVIQSAITKHGAVYTAQPQVALTGFKNPSGLLTMPDAKTVLIADYGTGTIYSVSPGAAPAGAAPAPSTAATAAPAAKAGSVLKLAADPSGALKFTSTKLTAKAGSVNLDFVNKSSVPHNFAIKQGNKLIGTSKTIAKGEDKSAVVTLAKGTYTFFCTIPGHEQAGMKGTLTVK